MAEIRRGLVIVGDSMCGKTCLLIAFCKDTFPELHVPTVLEHCNAVLQVDGQHINLSLLDTACQEEYDRLRPLSYANSDVILISFSISSPGSLRSVRKKWIPEVLHLCGNRPIILVGCKKDLRHDYRTIKGLDEFKQKPVSYTEGEKVGRKIRAYKYLECSANTNEGISEVLEHATRAALRPRMYACSPGGNKCCIL